MHIGQLIKQEMKKQRKTVVWLSRQLACTRPNIYKIYEKSSIDTSLLLRISTILQHDFFEELSKELKLIEKNLQS